MTLLALSSADDIRRFTPSEPDGLMPESFPLDNLQERFYYTLL
jgi:hypothetical protein